MIVHRIRVQNTRHLKSDTFKQLLKEQFLKYREEVAQKYLIFIRESYGIYLKANSYLGVLVVHIFIRCPVFEPKSVINLNTGLINL